jgi:hypothetical protein
MEQPSASRVFPLIVRMVVVLAVVTLAGWYTINVVRGKILPANRIDATHILLVSIGALTCFAAAWPNALNRLKTFEVKGVKLELLERVRERQVQQELELDNIRLIIPLLLPEHERNHLLNIAAHRIAHYHASERLQIELRRLTSMGLLRRISGRRIAEIDSKNVGELTSIVELTSLGKNWVSLLARLEPATPDGTRSP